MKQLLLLCTLALTLFAMSQKPISQTEKIDDWDFNATQKQEITTKQSRMMPISMASEPLMKMSNESLGLSVGGAKDADNFYENINYGYLPKVSSITYEGVFYDHTFAQVQQEKCATLFCPSYTTFKRKNPYTNQEEQYLSVGLNSNIKAQDFKRKKLNIVVVLDISGSMSSSFDKYYYDKNPHLKKEDIGNKSKMKIASESLTKMIDHLKDEDRLGVVLFDHQAYHAKPLRTVKNTKISATKKHILALKSQGGTNWSIGYQKGLTLFDKLSSKLKDPHTYENRIIFLTDAMPNRGELKKEGLFGLVENASQSGIYTTFIGIGVDFNNELVESVSKTKGANYYAVHSAKAFEKRLNEEFNFMVTPLVFNLHLQLEGNSYEIDAIYGSPDANRSTTQLMYVNTLFPSKSEAGAVKGGVILLKLNKLANTDTLALKISYEDRTGTAHESGQKVHFTQARSDSAISKAVLLSDYVTLMQNWLIDMRADCQDQLKVPPMIMPLEKRCMIYPPDRPLYPYMQSWERSSCKLKVSAGYHNLLAHFQQYFEKQSKQYPDDNFAKEKKVLKQLTTLHNSASSDKKVDDWQSKR
ncbi:MAG: VWA domain-containing protein [Epsilonproteobacteria bacterium]|nr:VWA domain-containing protein [Campylobacterota bacterium]